MIRKSGILLLFLFVMSFAKAQESDTNRKPLFYIGPYLGYNYNVHFGDFQRLTGYPSCCSNFSSGSGSGFAAGASFHLQLFPSIELNLRLGLSDIGGKFDKEDTLGGSIFRNTTTNQIVTTTAFANNQLVSSLILANLEPTLVMKYFKNVDLSIGLKIGYLFSSRFSQEELLVRPNDITFIDGTRTRNATKNEIIPNSNSFQLFGLLGIGYELEIKKDWYLVPEIRYSIPFINISDVSWKVSTFQFGGLLKIPIYPPPPPPPPKPVRENTIIQRDTSVIVLKSSKIDEKIKLVDSKSEVKENETEDTIFVNTLITEKYELTKYILANIKTGLGIIPRDKNGVEISKSNIQLVIEETEVEEGYPVLPHVFFPKNSSELSQTGLKMLTMDDAKKFNENQLNKNTLDIYNNLLNIIGSRLKANPKANITITGCNSNTDEEKNNQKLSTERANAVRDYLISVFEINPPQIKIKKQNLPTNPSNIIDPDGITENQRAEMYSDDFSIIKPVYLKEIEVSVNPPIIDVKPTVSSEAGLKSWNLLITQNNTEIRTASGESLQDNYIYKWLVSEEPMPKLESNILISFSAIDNYSQKSTSDYNLQIKQLTIKKKRQTLKDDKIIERFSLVLFDYDKAELTPIQKSILQDIKSRIKPNSKVIIAGYTDRIGDKVYNKELARKRCLETQKTLGVSDQNLSILPIGNDELLFDNNAPEGRSYCRTVKITIETPVTN